MKRAYIDIESFNDLKEDTLKHAMRGIKKFISHAIVELDLDEKEIKTLMDTVRALETQLKQPMDSFFAATYTIIDTLINKQNNKDTEENEKAH